MAKEKATSEIVTAAADLDAEIERLERATSALEKQELRSRKHLERAGKLLVDFADAEDALGEKVRALNDAITASQKRHVAAAERVQTYAAQVSTRTAEYRELAMRQAEIGKSAATLTAALQPAAAATSTDEEQLSALNEAAAQLDVIVTTLNALFEDVRKADFFDLTKEIDAVRQAVIAARSKLAGNAPIRH